MSQPKKTRIQIEFLCTERDQAKNLRLTRLDPVTKKRVAIKCIVEYDFEESLSDNIEAMLSRIEFSGDTEYVLCMERTLQNKPWDMLKKGLMVDLDCFKEEFLEHIIIERELYFLVPRCCIDDEFEDEVSTKQIRQKKSSPKQKVATKAKSPTKKKTPEKKLKSPVKRKPAKSDSESESGDEKESNSDRNSQETSQDNKEEASGSKRKLRSKGKPQKSGKADKPEKEAKARPKQKQNSKQGGSDHHSTETLSAFVNSEEVRSAVYLDEKDFLKRFVGKMNKIAKEANELQHERYEIRCNREKEVKYIQVRCTCKNCKFSIWFNYKGSAQEPTHLTHARNINMSHSISAHAEVDSKPSESQKTSQDEGEKNSEKMDDSQE